MLFSAGADPHVLQLDGRRPLNVRSREIAGCRELGYLGPGVSAGLDEDTEVPQERPRANGRVAGLSEFGLPSDQILMTLEELGSRRRLRRGQLECLLDLGPALADEVGQAERQPGSAVCPPRKVDLGINFPNPMIPGPSALAVPQPSLQESNMLRPHRHRREAVREREVAGLVIAEKGLRQCEHRDEFVYPVVG